MRDLISQTKVATTVHCRAFAMARQYCAQRRWLAHVSRNKDRSSKRLDARKRVRRNHGSGGVAASTGGKGGSVDLRRCRHAHTSGDRSIPCNRNRNCNCIRTPVRAARTNTRTRDHWRTCKQSRGYNLK